MKLFKPLSLVVIFALSTYSCEDKNSNASVAINNDEPIEIEFIKEGELSIANQDSIIKHLDIEIAKSDNERAIGLMNRSSLEENQGMLFEFERDNSSGFYMKDTRIPLDIIFIGADSTVITITPNRQPYDMSSQGASQPYRYVLEVNGGKAAAWGIKEGISKISWQEL